MSAQVLSASSAVTIGGYNNRQSSLSNILKQCKIQRSPSNVKRCLFPSENKMSESESLQLARMELKRQLEADCQRWNFDFVKEVPLDNNNNNNSRLEWTKVEHQTQSTSTVLVNPYLNHSKSQPKCQKSQNFMKNSSTTSNSPLRQSQITGKNWFIPKSYFLKLDFNFEIFYFIFPDFLKPRKRTYSSSSLSGATFKRCRIWNLFLFFFVHFCYHFVIDLIDAFFMYILESDLTFLCVKTKEKKRAHIYYI